MLCQASGGKPGATLRYLCLVLRVCVARATHPVADALAAVPTAWYRNADIGASLAQLLLMLLVWEREPETIAGFSHASLAIFGVSLFKAVVCALLSHRVMSWHVFWLDRTNQLDAAILLGALVVFSVVYAVQPPGLNGISHFEWAFVPQVTRRYSIA